jgi:hypothetical protein
MHSMKFLVFSLCFALCFAVSAVSAQEPARDVAWPREAKGADGTVVTVFQPQVERWTDNTISGRAAVAVARPGEKEPRYGVIELSARTEVDKSADLVTLSGLRITKSSFPGATEQQSSQYLATLRAAVTKSSWPASARALQANLAVTEARSKQKGQPVKNDPPQILFRTAPSLLVLVDGEPVLRPAKDGGTLVRVINTTAAIFQEPSTGTFYLWALGRWWEAKALEGEWKGALLPSMSLDNARAALGKQFEPLEGKDADGKSVKDADGKPLFEGVTPQIILATKPTELLQSKGEPKMSPIPGTQLLYMANSTNDILFELGAQTYYVVLSGRWFSAKSMQGPWTHVPAASLPAEFAKIPPDHLEGDVLASVPGTPQAKEAAIANQVPQTATVQRDTQPAPVAYDGDAPKWQAIEGTPLSYAPNTASPVIRVDAKTYYMVQSGVWFSATAPAGPWSVAVGVPAVIYTIPTSSPLHYVTYVRVYGSTPTVVYVGYTPGYYGTVMTTDGVVVYGTGYYYPPYVGAYWYPYPPTYGFGVYMGAGFFVGIAIMPPWHVGGCCWYGGPPMVIHHGGNFNVNNGYNRWGGKSTSITGPGGRNVKATQVGNTTLAKGAGSDNVYAGRDGNVYRRDGQGDWQKYNGKGDGWSDMDRGDRGERPSQLPAGDRGQAKVDNSLPGGDRRGSESINSLDRQYQGRQAGDQRAQQYRSAGGGGGFQGGGGGMRGGGGGGRGGGRR